MENKNWFNKKIEEIETELKTNQEKGLTEEQVAEIRKEKGYNELQAGKKKTLLQRFADQFKDFSIIVLIIAAIVSGIVGNKVKNLDEDKYFYVLSVLNKIAGTLLGGCAILLIVNGLKGLIKMVV